MQQSFATPADHHDAFFSLMVGGSVTVLVMAAVMFVLLWDRDRKLRVKAVALLVAVGLAGMLWFSYSTTFSRFIAAEATASGMRLRYTGPFEHDVVVPRESIDTVLFGIPGKSQYGCYIKVLLKSGVSRRSATVWESADACKQRRVELLQALASGHGS